MRAEFVLFSGSDKAPSGILMEKQSYKIWLFSWFLTLVLNIQSNTHYILSNLLKRWPCLAQWDAGCISVAKEKNQFTSIKPEKERLAGTVVATGMFTWRASIHMKKTPPNKWNQPTNQNLQNKTKANASQQQQKRACFVSFVLFPVLSLEGKTPPGPPLVWAVPLWVTSLVGGVFLLRIWHVTRNTRSRSQLMETSTPTLTSWGASFHSWNIGYQLVMSSESHVKEITLGL